MKRKIFLLFLIMMTGYFSYGIKTDIIVRAKAKDAKFIGSSIGGAYVLIKNKVTQEILAQGKTTGSTGNTNLIMRTPHERGDTITDEQTAKFMATLDLSEPVFVTIEVHSPYSSKQARAKATTELWLIPGKHILGDGIILEIPGFIVDVLTPRTHEFISIKALKEEPLKVQANIVMMCGCTISKGGLWDSEKMDVRALIKKDGNYIFRITSPRGVIKF